jgi:lysyl-tRNA synthetase class 2
MSEPGDSRILEDRREKVNEIRKQGINPYPNDFKREDRCIDVRFDAEGLTPEQVESSGKRYVISGRVMAVRDFGKAAFLQLEDGSGRIQIFVKRDVLGEEAYALYKLWDVGDIVGVSGTPFVTRTGELTIQADSIALLTSDTGSATLTSLPTRRSVKFSANGRR